MNFFKNKIVRVVLIILTLVMLYFIFAMSAYDGDASSELSAGLLETINLFLSRFGLEGILTEYVLRKIAHYSEYCVLGGLLFLDVVSFTESPFKARLYAPLIGICVAMLDELSQNLAEGRTPKVFDVFIDFCGVLTAALILYFIFELLRKAPYRR